MKSSLLKIEHRKRRQRKVRSRVLGTLERPRLSVFRSTKHLFVQLIDDTTGKTLASASDQECKSKKLRKIEVAVEVGTLIAQKAAEQKISQCVFDRGGRLYHGRVAAVAKGAREGGLKF